MKKLMIIVLTLVNFVDASAQKETIELANLTFKLGAGGQKDLFFGFAKGDQIIFSFEVVNGKPLKEVEITELPSNSKFMDFKSANVENQQISVHKTSVYQFRFKNSSMGKRICKVKIQRVPGSAETVNFNTGWRWETKYDTSYTQFTKDTLVGYDTIHYKETVKELVGDTLIDMLWSEKNQRVHSSLSGKPTRTYVKIDLPNNKNEKYRTEKTIVWAYWIGVGEEASKAYATNLKSVAKLSSSIASVYGSPLAGIALGELTELMLPKIGEDISFEFINDYRNVEAYMNGLEYRRFDHGKGVAAYGKNDNRLNGVFYIGLHNDNYTLGLNVEIKIVVIRQVKTYKDHVYNRQKLKPRYLTLHKTKTNIKSRKIRVNQ